MESETPLKDRVAVVTGSTRGIGKLIAQSLANAGAKVVLSGRSTTATRQAYQQLAKLGDIELLGVECDVREFPQVELLAQKTIERFGKIDIWINNAGITSPYGRTVDIESDRWRDVIATNVYMASDATDGKSGKIYRCRAGLFTRLVEVESSRHLCGR